MLTLDELKQRWEQNEIATASAVYSPAALEKLIRSRVKKYTKNSMQYFWASFTLQVIVYSLLCQVIVKYWQRTEIICFAIGGILLFLPFTIMLMRKFKKLATEKPSQGENTGISLHDYVLRQETLLRSFFRFKKWYEFFLIPFSSTIGVFLVFELYVPGGVNEHWSGALVTFLITLISCGAAIYAENKKSFVQPIQQLQHILDEFKDVVE